MVFWILVGLWALTIVAVFWWNLRDGNYVGESIVYAIMGGGLLGAFGWGLVFLVINGVWGERDIKNELVADRSIALKALGTDSEVSGRSYYLGGGYVGEQRVLNYITKGTDGSIRVASAKAWASTIKEDAGPDEARVRIMDWKQSQKWLWPWDGATTTYYEFHIPADSVVESYTIDNK